MKSSEDKKRKTIVDTIRIIAEVAITIIERIKEFIK